MDALPIVHPEAGALLQEIELLTEELAKLFAEREQLLGTVKQNLEADFRIKIGAAQLGRLEIEWEIARLRREIELVQTAINKPGWKRFGKAAL